MNTFKSSSVETDDWKIGCFIDWNPKRHLKTCPRCLGSGEVGGGLGDVDNPHTCPECLGVKIIVVGPTSPKPEIPEALIEHMRKAWWDYMETNK